MSIGPCNCCGKPSEKVICHACVVDPGTVPDNCQHGQGPSTTINNGCLKGHIHTDLSSIVACDSETTNALAGAVSLDFPSTTVDEQIPLSVVVKELGYENVLDTLHGQRAEIDLLTEQLAKATDTYDQLWKETFWHHVQCCTGCNNAFPSCGEYPWELVRAWLVEHRPWTLRTLRQDPLFIPRDERILSGCICEANFRCPVHWKENGLKEKP